MAAHRHAANRLSLATSILHQPRTPPPPRGSTRPAHCQSSALAPRPLRRLFVAAPLPPPLAPPLALPPLALPPLALPPLALPPLALPPPPRLRQIVRPARDVRRRSVWHSAPPFWMATSRPTQKRTSRQRRHHQRRRHQGSQRRRRQRRQRRRRQRRRREPQHSRHLQHRCRLHGRQHSRRQRRSRECRECRQCRRGQRRRLGSPPVLPRRPKRPRRPLPLSRPQLPMTTTHSRASSARLFGR